MKSLASHILSLSLLLFSGLLCTGCVFDFETFSFSTGPSHATIADDLRKEGKLKESIAEYEQHVSDRLASKRKFPDENPYFYYLLIGDVYLELDDPAEARRAYERALDEKVEPRLTSARLRRLGQWYEEKGKYEEALEVLKKYRDLDPEMYNLDIDQVHKAIVKKEQDEEEKARSTTPEPN